MSWYHSRPVLWVYSTLAFIKHEWSVISRKRCFIEFFQRTHGERLFFFTETFLLSWWISRQAQNKRSSRFQRSVHSPPVAPSFKSGSDWKHKPQKRDTNPQNKWMKALTVGLTHQQPPRQAHFPMWNREESPIVHVVSWATVTLLICYPKIIGLHEGTETPCLPVHYVLAGYFTSL